jgi:transposase
LYGGTIDGNEVTGSEEGMTMTLVQPSPEQALLLNVAPSEKPQVGEPTASSGAGFISVRPFREWNPSQQQLLPQDLRAALGEGHLACFFVDLGKVLDFGPILRSYTEDCGQPPYHPVMMALLLMYAYAVGVTSSREIERRCGTDLAFRYIAAGETPDHDTLCAFRVRHLESFKELFRQTLQVAREMKCSSWVTLPLTGRSSKPTRASTRR